MSELPPLLEETRATLPAAVQAYIAALEAQVTALAGRVAELGQQVVELTARLGQSSRNSSRPPSSDPPGTARPKPAPGRRRPGGQPGHPGRFRPLLPPEQVDHVALCVPASCADCGAALSAVAGPDDPADERRQVTEVPPLAATVTEYRLAARRCDQCGTVTRASAPADMGTAGC